MAKQQLQQAAQSISHKEISNKQIQFFYHIHQAVLLTDEKKKSVLIIDCTT